MSEKAEITSPDAVVDQAESLVDMPRGGSAAMVPMDLGFPDDMTMEAFEEWFAEVRNRRDWRRFLSPVEKQWQWQDSAPITMIRNLLIRIAIASRPRKSTEHPPPYEASAETPDQLKVLRVLEATKSVIDMVTREQKLLILELRARQASWDTIGMALGIRRQTAHRKFGDLKVDRFWSERLQFELDAARRVALQRSEDSELSDDERTEAREFLNQTASLSDKKTREDLQRLYQ